MSKFKLLGFISLLASNFCRLEVSIGRRWFTTVSTQGYVLLLHQTATNMSLKVVQPRDESFLALFEVGGQKYPLFCVPRRDIDSKLK
jgi:hypothetical protein